MSLAAAAIAASLLVQDPAAFTLQHQGRQLGSATSWALCAGVLIAKSQHVSDPVLSALLDPMARRALAQAKVASNPEGLTPGQLDSVAVNQGASFLREIQATPSALPTFEARAQECMRALAALPE